MAWEIENNAAIEADESKVIQPKWEIEKTQPLSQSVMDAEDQQTYNVPLTMDGVDANFAIQTQHKGASKASFFGKVKTGVDVVGSSIEEVFQDFNRAAVEHIGGLTDSLVLDKFMGYQRNVKLLEKWENGDWSFFQGRELNDEEKQDIIRRMKDRIETIKNWRERTKKFFDKGAQIMRPDEKMDNADKFFIGVSSGIISSAEAVGAAMITKNPTVASAAIASTYAALKDTEYFDKAIAAGETAEDASRNATIAAGIEGSLEFVGDRLLLGIAKFKPIKAIGNNIINSSVVKMAKNKVGRTALAKIASRHPQSIWGAAFKGGMTEGTTELLQEGLGMGFENATDVADYSFDEILTSSLFAFGVGMIPGAGMGVVGTSIYNSKISKDNEAIKKILKENTPELTEQEVQVAADNVQEVLMQQGAEYENEFNKLLRKETEIDVMPDGLTSEGLKTETRNMLKEKYGMSDEDIDRTVEVAINYIDGRNGFNETYNEYFDKMESSGYDHNTADAAARLLAARAVTLSKQEGVSTEEVRKRWNLTLARQSYDDFKAGKPVNDGYAARLAQIDEVLAATPDSFTDEQKKALRKGLSARARYGDLDANNFNAATAAAWFEKMGGDGAVKAINKRVQAIMGILNASEGLEEVKRSKKINPSELNPFDVLLDDKLYKKVAKIEKDNKGDSLLSFIIKRGGLKDVGGELKAMDAGKMRVGLINNKSGNNLDDIALAAWENGYFPSKTERPEINDLLDAIRDELFGQEKYQYQEGNTESLIEYVDALAEQMSILGVDYSGMTAAEAEKAYNEAAEEYSKRAKQYAFDESQDGELFEGDELALFQSMSLADEMSKIDAERLEIERKNINPELKGRENEIVKAVKINRFFVDRKGSKEIGIDDVMAVLDKTTQKNKNDVRVLKNNLSGETVTLSNNSISKMFDTTRSRKDGNIGGILGKECIANIGKIFDSALLIKTTPDTKHETKNKIRRYANVVNSSDETFIVKLTVKEMANNRQELTDIEIEENSGKDLAAYDLKVGRKNTAVDALDDLTTDKSAVSSGNDIIINDLIEFVNSYTDETIQIDGVVRQARNSDGARIAKTEEGLRAFYKWFGDSKVVDEQGRPLVVYHGGKKGIKIFDKSKISGKGQWGGGFYFSSRKDIADDFATLKNGVTYPVYLNIKKPFTDRNKFIELERSGGNVTQKIKDAGYDGIIIGGEYVVFEPNQIKSVNNRGTWDAGNDNIYYQKSNLGEPIKSVFDLKVGDKTREFGTVEEIDSAEQVIKIGGMWYKMMYIDTMATYGSLHKSKGVVVQEEQKETADEEIKKVSDNRTVVDEQKPRNAEYNQKAKDYFGTTRNLNEAGYILTDGGLLDFSGKKHGGRAGSRTVDHREVSDIGVSMEDFINSGNIRYLPESNSLLMSDIPTAQQYKQIDAIIDKAEGEITIELMSDANNWGSDGDFSRDYSGATLAKIKRDINAYYRGGGVRQITSFFQSGFVSSKQELVGDYFDADRFEGTGEGNAVHGWGNYVLKNQETNKAHYFDWMNKLAVKINGELKSGEEWDTVQMELKEGMSADELITELDRRASGQAIYMKLHKTEADKIAKDHPDVVKYVELEEQMHQYPVIGEGNEKRNALFKQQQEMLEKDAKNKSKYTRYRDLVVLEIPYDEMILERVSKAVKTITEEVAKNKDAFAIVGRGAQYEVDVPEDNFLLDEKKSFIRQSKYVKERLKEAANELPRVLNETKLRELTGDEKYGSSENFKTYYAKKAFYRGKERALELIRNNEDSKNGAELKLFVENLDFNSFSNAVDFAGKTGKEIYNIFSVELGSQKDASKLLEKYGIKGIKYDGARDGIGYVIFNGRDMPVVKRWLQTDSKGGAVNPRGAFVKRGDENIIFAFEGADASTIIHELGHFFLSDMKKFAENEKTAEQLAEIYKYLGSDNGELTVEQEERFADTFEVYLLDGRAPNQILKTVFGRFKRWISSLWAEVKRLNGVKLNDEVRNTFNDMFGGKSLDYSLQTGTLKMAQALERGIISGWQINRAMQLLYDGRMSKGDMEHLIQKLKGGMKNKEFVDNLKEFEAKPQMHNRQVLTEWDYKVFKNQLESLSFNRDKVKNQIDKLLKWSEPRSRGGKLVGRFPNKQLNDAFDRYRELVNMDKNEAKAKQQENIELIEHQMKAGGDIDIDLLVFENRLLSYGLGKISNSELLKLYDALAESYNMGRLTDKITGEVKHERRRKMVERAKAVLTAGDTINPNVESSEIKKRLARFGISQQSWSGLLDTLSMNDKASKTGKSALNQDLDMFEAEQAKYAGVALDSESISEKITEALRGVGDPAQTVTSYINKELDKKTTIEWAGLKDPKERNPKYQKFIPFKKTFTKDQLIDIYMKAKDADTKDIMINDPVNQYNNEFLRKVEDELNAYDRAVADALFAFYDENYTRFNVFYEDHFGVSLPKSKYYTPRAMTVDGVNIDDKATHGYAGFSGAKQRVAKAGAAVINIQGAMRALTKYINQQNHYMGYMDKLADINAVLANKEIKSIIGSLFGNEMNKRIEYEINNLANNGNDKIDAWGKMWNKVRANYAKSVLAVKPSLAIKQLTSFPAYWENISAADFVAGIADFFAHPKEAIETLGSTTLMKTRGTDIIRDFDQISKSNLFAKMKQAKGNIKWDDLLMLNIKFGDRGAIYMGGWALYKSELKKNLAEGMSEEEAKAKALNAFEKITDETQQSGRLSQQSYMQSNSALRAFTMFCSSQNQYLRKEINAVRGVLTGRMSKKQAAKTLFIYHVLLPVFFQVVSDGFRFDKDNDLRAAVLGSLNGWFILNKILENLYNLALDEGNKMFKARMSVRDLVPFWGSVEDLKNDVLKFIDEDIDAVDVIYDAIKPVGEVAGLPLKYAKDIAENAGDYADEGEYGKELLLWLGWSPYSLRESEDE